MNHEKVKILVVDDSAFMRKALSRIIQSDPSFEVIGTARNGQEALPLIERLRPDAVTLDVEMPGMNGLQTVEAIRRSFTTPVLMVSSITKSGSDIAIRCLEAGAFDVVSKPESYVSMNISDISSDLLNKLKSAVFGQSHAPKSSYALPSLSARMTEILPASPRRMGDLAQKVVTIGSSTGGPMALSSLLSGISKELPAGLVIVQHMPMGNFIHSLAERLNSVSPFEVRVAEDGDIVRNGVAFIGAIGKHVALEKTGATLRIRLVSVAQEHLHCPAVDVLFESAGRVAGPNNISCILTGMGSDGTRGLSSVYDNGGYVIAQSETSCAIYGMPRSAVEAGLVHEIAGLENIPYCLSKRLANGLNNQISKGEMS